MIAVARNPWCIVIASVFGLMVGTATINIFAFSVFLKPVSDDLGLSRGAFSSGVLLTNIMNAVATPLVGVLVDRFGSRRVMLPGIALLAITVAALSQLQASPMAVFYLLFALVGVFGAAQTTVPYAALITKWFDRDRGLALGVAMAGVGLGVVVVPQLAEWLIGAAGWRTAYVGLGALIVLCAFVPVALCFREPPAIAQDARTREGAHAGLSAAEAFTGSWRFWVVSIGFFVGVVSINGTLAHLIPMLTDRGMAGGTAAAILSAAGVAMIIGRIASGWCLDRYHGPTVAIGFFILPAVGIAALSSGEMGLVPLLGALACGLGIGAQTGLQAYFVGRYFGLKAYGTIYGTSRALFLLGSGFGPFLAGLSFDLWQSYAPVLMAFAVALVTVAATFVALGPYRFGSRAHTAVQSTPAPLGLAPASSRMS